MIDFVLLAADQSAMYPAGRQSQLISHTWWIFIGITTFAYVATMLFVLVLGFRSRRHRNQAAGEAPTLSEPPRENRLSRIVAGAVALTTVLLFVLMLSDFMTGRNYHALGGGEDAIDLKINARQWWWQVKYHDAMSPWNNLTTANEICLPVGKTVRIDLSASDVIHSFWVPNLAGKKDAIPGHPTSLWIRPDKEGKYEGQCAEFCGLGHAKMRLSIKVVSQAEYQRWYAAQHATAREPSTDLERRGKDVFMASTCVMCHTISGTPATATVGPGLSHIGSREAIAADSLKNTPENMAQWILDPPSLKPGAHMPQHNFSPEELNAMVAYLESLK